MPATRSLMPPMFADQARVILLNGYQRDFPLVPAPFARIGAQTGLDESAVIAIYRAWLEAGVVGRIGAVFSPSLGAGALVAMCVAPGRIETVAAQVSALAAVNHNYEREHHYNLWFVVTAPSPARRDAIIAGLERETGCATLVLPLEEAFHIDLGFDLVTGAGQRAHRPAADAARALTDDERALAAALQGGLAPVPAPYARLGDEVGLSEARVLEVLRRWLEEGLVRRLGVIVRHRELGIAANAMCVWDVPDGEVGALGRRLAAEPAVTLCYRRRRALPHWRYNLFCMIHGRARGAVLDARAALATRLGLDAWPHAVLFSRRRFKQTGARYVEVEA